MIFSRNYRHRQEMLNLNINGKLINTVTKARFLGINFDQQLNLNDHVNSIVNSCKSKINLVTFLLIFHIFFLLALLAAINSTHCH